MEALWRFAMNMPQQVDGDLPGEMWCQECGIRTNHRDHGTADDVKPDEERLDEEDEDGC